MRMRTMFSSSKQAEPFGIASVSVLCACVTDALQARVSRSSSRFRLTCMTDGCYQFALLLSAYYQLKPDVLWKKAPVAWYFYIT